LPSPEIDFEVVMISSDNCPFGSHLVLRVLTG